MQKPFETKEILLFMCSCCVENEGGEEFPAFFVV